MTVIVTVAVALPPEFIAKTVYVLVEDNTVGVPEISPVEVANTSPVGNVGEIDQEVTVPPVYCGVAVVIKVPFSNVNEFGVYDTEEGAISLTTIVTICESVPPAFVAVTV